MTFSYVPYKPRGGNPGPPMGEAAAYSNIPDKLRGGNPGPPQGEAAAYSYIPYRPPHKRKVFREDKHKRLRDSLYWYRPDLTTVLEKPPHKIKRAVVNKPPWNCGSKGRYHIYL